MHKHYTLIKQNFLVKTYCIESISARAHAVMLAKKLVMYKTPPPQSSPIQHAAAKAWFSSIAFHRRFMYCRWSFKGESDFRNTKDLTTSS